MKKKLPLRLLALFLLPLIVMGQNLTTSASLGSVNRYTPLIGYNGPAIVPAKPAQGIVGANWAQQWFIDSAATLNAALLRFPGGTNANHWDWKTGWYRPGYQPAGSSLQIRVDEFKPAVLACQSEGIYVVNMETSTPSYEMDGIRHADSIGLNFKYFELGNEHNLYDPNNLNQLMSSTAYAALAKTFYDSIIALHPTAKICAVGGNTKAYSPNWNTDVLNVVPNLDALTFHVYLTANNADLAFNVNRALAVPYGDVSNYLSLPYRYVNAGFSTLPTGKEVYVTEFNLDELQLASQYVISQTWTHVLYNTAFYDFFLKQGNITVVLNHTIAGGSNHYEGISKTTQKVTANGISSKLLHDVAKGSATCQDMSFSGNPTMSYGSELIPKIIGWKFNHSNSEKGLLCNFSTDTIKVSLSGLFPSGVNFTQYYADTAFIVAGLSSLNQYTGTSADTIAIYPHAIAQVTAAVVTGKQNLGKSTQNELWLFPNPATQQVQISTKCPFLAASLNIYDQQGKIVQQLSNITGTEFQINTSSLKAGTYFVQVVEKGQCYYATFLVE